MGKTIYKGTFFFIQSRLYGSTVFCVNPPVFLQMYNFFHAFVRIMIE